MVSPGVQGRAPFSEVFASVVHGSERPESRSAVSWFADRVGAPTDRVRFATPTVTGRFIR
jgi:hypothetical protein